MWPVDPDDFEPAVAAPEHLDDAWLFLFQDDQLLVVAGAGPWEPVDHGVLRWLDGEVLSEHYLGRFRGKHCMAVETRGAGAPDGHAFTDLRSQLGRVERQVFDLIGRAQQVVHWYRDHQHCGRCGAPTEEHGNDRATTCSACGLVNYPRLSPSIIVLVRRGEEMLLARNARWPSGFYSTLAGFVEPGESVEQALHREVHEEVGVRVHNLRYLGSQPWPFPNSLMLGFHADYLDGDIVCQEEEIADAQWFHYSEPPKVPPKTSISRWLIDAFLEEHGASAETPSWR